MKIGTFIFADRTSGGVYQYTYSVLDALAQWDTHNEFIVFICSDNQLPSDVFPGSQWKLEPMDPAIMYTKDIKQHLSGDGLDMVHPGINLKAQNFFKKHQIDLMLYTVPTRHSFEWGIPYIMAIHDLQHRLHPEFPEVSAGDVWTSREYMFRNAVRHAQAILVDSEVGKEDALNFYGDYIRPDAVFPLPFVPFYYADRKGIDKDGLSSVREKYQLPKNYLFYPAQFWLHKNHSRLIHAIHLLRFTHKLDISLILVGSGSGFSRTGEARGLVFQNAMLLAEQLGVKDLVRSLGYVSDEEMPALYSLATALTMPTFFGPTNIPVLEAWSFGCPVISSDIRGIQEQVGDAGLLANPADASAMADCILKLLADDNLRNSLIKAGYKKIDSYRFSDFARRLYTIIESVQCIKCQDDFENTQRQ